MKPQKSELDKRLWEQVFIHSFLFKQWITSFHGFWADKPKRDFGRTLEELVNHEPQASLQIHPKTVYHASKPYNHKNYNFLDFD